MTANLHDTSPLRKYKWKFLKDLVLVLFAEVYYYDISWSVRKWSLKQSFSWKPFLQEFGQSTPEIRKSARKIPSLFKKRKLEKEMSANSEKQTVQRPRTKVNGISKDDDSDSSAIGEYIEVKWFRLRRCYIRRKHSFTVNPVQYITHYSTLQYSTLHSLNLQTKPIQFLVPCNIYN